MARRNRHRSNGVLGSFVALPKYLLQSAAWRTLKPVARAAFVELVGVYNGKNNGWLGMSARSLAAAINVSRATAARALKELTERGFIEQTRASAFSGGRVVS
jgi:DNA-binding MarR family transcriptional regulator